MIVDNNGIVEATETEMFLEWFSVDVISAKFRSVCDFHEFIMRAKAQGTVVVDDPE